MKKIITLFAILITTNSFAQTDSFEVKENKIAKAYNFLTMAKKEENSIWKLKAIPFNLDKMFTNPITMEDVPIIFSFEKKITPSLSFQIESKNILFLTNTTHHDEYFLDARDSNNYAKYYIGEAYNNQYIFSSSLAVEFRYYYNMKRRMHKKHLANNFSANYFAIRGNKNVLCTGIDFYNMRYDMESPFYDKNKHPFYDNNISFYYGIQRRFLKYFFCDIQGGASYRYGSTKPFWNYYYINSNNKIGKEINLPPRIVGMFNLRVGFAF